MSGIFNSMNTATKGLMAQQTALHTTGHNISNINTEGFTRQRVDMKADRAFSLAGVGQLGTGVKMESVVRMIDNHVSKQIRDENSTLNRFQEKSDVITQLEVIFNEPSDTGLNFNISEMFDAFQNLSGKPGDLNFKTVAVEKLKTLTDTLNHMANQIEGLDKDTHELIEKNILDFNSEVDQLSSLNKQIFNISIKGQIPNDLLDQRDLMLKELSAIGDVDVEFDEYGRVDIKMDGKEILTKEGEQRYIGYDKDIDATSKKREIKLYKDKYDPDANPTQVGEQLNITNGKLLGNMDALKDIKVAKENLDNLSKTMAEAINRVHKTFEYKDENGDLKSGNIFEVGAGGAINIKINDALLKDPSLLKSGEHSVGHTDYIQEDNSTALAISALRNKKLDKDGNVSTDGKGNTIGGYYRDIVIKIGVSKQHADNMVDNQIALTNQLEMRRESVSGVSINDEITNVIKFQKAYEANAKVLSVLTEMLDVLINRTGV